MYRFIKYIFIFLLCLTGVFSLLNLLQSNFNLDPLQYKNQYSTAINSLPKIDGIILGTSHATHSLRPTLLDESNKTYYNFALNGANPEFNYKWYNEIYLLNREKPNYCLFAVDFFMFDEGWLWRRFEQDAEYFPCVFFLMEMMKFKSNTTDLIVNRFPFIKYRSQIKSSLKLNHSNSSFKEENYDRGYISFSTPFDSAYYKPKIKFDIDSTQVKYFKALVKEMLNDDVNIIFIMTPEYGLSVKDYKKMESLKIIEEVAYEHDILFLNYNTELRSYLNQDIKYFSDWGHLNHFGAELFSKKIANELKERTHNNVHKR